MHDGKGLVADRLDRLSKGVPPGISGGGFTVLWMGQAP